MGVAFANEHKLGFAIHATIFFGEDYVASVVTKLFYRNERRVGEARDDVGFSGFGREARKIEISNVRRLDGVTVR